MSKLVRVAIAPELRESINEGRKITNLNQQQHIEKAHRALMLVYEIKANPLDEKRRSEVFTRLMTL